ncbi:MAG: hypothetical protein ABL989_13595 [Gammaproteobacteria bacterium]
MDHRRKRGIAVVAVFAALACVAMAGWVLAPRGDRLRQGLVREIGLRFGVQAAIGSASWQLLPAPALTVLEFSTHHDQPITIRQFVAVLDVGSTLLRREICLDRIEVDGAVIPAVSLAALRGRPGVARSGPESDDPGRLPVGHVRFRGVTWISRTDVSLPIEGEVDFDPGWRPRYAEVRRAASATAARLTLAREGDADRWRTRAAFGSGTANGIVLLTTRDDGLLVLGGTLEPRDIEVASAVASLNRISPVRGEANGRTTVSAQGRTAAELARSLRLLTEFTIAPATLLRLDVDKAIRTLGLQHDGQTTLQSMTGSMELQNTGEGPVLRFTDIEARADSFAATGEGTVFNRRIDAHGTVDLLNGLVGVPFAIRGTTRKPRIAVFGGKPPDAPVLPVPADEGATPPAGARDEN